MGGRSNGGQRRRRCCQNATNTTMSAGTAAIAMILSGPSTMSANVPSIGFASSAHCTESGSDMRRDRHGITGQGSGTPAQAVWMEG